MRIIPAILLMLLLPAGAAPAERPLVLPTDLVHTVTAMERSPEVPAGFWKII
jgi:hypothetical protein